ncbi:MAG: LUD domain-containing protein [Chloroflexota bacterium]
MTTRFHRRIRQAIADEALQTALDANAERRRQGSLVAFSQLPDYQTRRQRAHAVRADVITNLDAYLDQFLARVRENDIVVHRAADAGEAVRVVLDIVANLHRTQIEAGEKVLVAKSKSMVTEEIQLNQALEAAGQRVVETDLGEYIVQLRGERPSHIITPAVHLRRHEVGQLFHEKLGIPYSEDIPTLTATAREVLREVFLDADVGLSGVNFGVVTTGTLCLVTNEGNGRMVTTLPPVHIALMGIERLVPTLDDLALMLSLLPRSATGQKLSVYTSLIHSPRRPGDPDGPQERHLILLDNGRSAMRHSPLREALFCIRCGACLNACPVFRELGGHAYLGRDGAIAPYPGPIGSVVSPGLAGCENFGHLAQASTLCGACKQACPVELDLPGLLLRLRAGLTPEQGTIGIIEGRGIPDTIKLGLKAFRLAAGRPGLFACGQRVLGLLAGRPASGAGEWLRLPRFTGWGASKDFPRPARRPFRQRWARLTRETGVRPSDSSVARESPPLEHAPAEQVPPVERFCREVAALGGNTVCCGEEGLPDRLAALLNDKGIDRVQAWDEIARRYGGRLQEAGISLVRDADPGIKAGITGAIAAIAETGTLVIPAGKGRPLTASLLPEIHIAVLRKSDILADLETALRLPDVAGSASVVLVSGPSRTADIEMTLTIGVHGPGELHVFVIE